MKNLTESLEKYLFAIYELSKDKSDIIVKDVAQYLDFGGAATSTAIKTLAKKGFVNYVPYGKISLTQKGLEVVELKIYRHNTISKFLNRVLNINEVESEQNASAIEYSMTEDVLERFVHFLDFMEQCSCSEPKWMKACNHHLVQGEISEKCRQCVSGNKCSCCGEK